MVPVTPQADVPEQSSGPKPMSSTLSGIMGKFGIAESKQHDSVQVVVEDELRSQGIEAVFEGLRYHEVLLSANSQNSALLRYETDRIIDVLSGKFPGQVTRIRVRTRN
jgi:hypothetical protein